MKTTKAILTALALSSLSSLALANPYVGANYAMLNIDGDGVDVDLDSLVIKGGYQFNDWLSAEARVGFGIGDDTFRDGGASYKVKLDRLYGGYIAAGWPVNEMFYPYVIGGYTRAEVKVSAFGVSATGKENSASIGIGANFNFGESMAFNVEFMSYFDDTEAFSLGLAYRF